VAIRYPRFHKAARQHRRRIKDVIATLAMIELWQITDDIRSINDALTSPAQAIKPINFYKQQVAILAQLLQ
jgi:hypothetical protein